MPTYPKSRIDKRWNKMPEELREVLFSPAYGETVFQIAENYNLNEIKSEKLVRLTGFVMYGFIHPEELAVKLKEETDIDKDTAKEIAEEVDKKIFETFRTEILDMYSPVAETATQVESIKAPPKKEEKEEAEGEQIGNIEITEGEEEPSSAEATEGKQIQREGVITPEKPEGGEEKKENEPFVIHQEEGGTKETKKEKGKRKKSFQLGSFFGKEKDKEKKAGRSAKIQTPGKKKDKDTKKTVHYSEYRSTRGTDKGKGFIDTSTAQQKSGAGGGEANKSQMQSAKKTSSEKPQKAQKQQTPPKKKKDSGPSVEGNKIDLRNL